MTKEPSPSLAVVGVNARSLAQSAARAGWDVVAVDTFGHADLGPLVTHSRSLSRDLGGLMPMNPVNWHARLAQAVRAQKANALAFVGGFENYPELVAEMSAEVELLGNSPATLQAVRDPDQLRAAVLTSGIHMPQVLPPGAQPDPALRWLRKRRKSAGGFAIEPWTGQVPDDPDSLVQRWVDGVPGSVSFVANGHMAHVFALTRQLSGDPVFGASGFVYVGNLLAPQPDPALLHRLQHLATSLTHTFGLVGLNGVDLLVNGEEVTVLEVNPRFSASMELVEEALGMSLFGWHVTGCRRMPIPAFPERRDRKVFGQARVFARRDGFAPDTTHWPEEGRRDVPHTGEALRTGLPICTVTVVGIDETQCYARLVTQAQAVWNLL